MQDFKKLKVWRQAHELSIAIHRLARNFPRHELFALAPQIRRATYSIEFNIAEGCGRGSDTDFARFLQIAMGSATEVECQLLLARDLGIVSEYDFLSCDTRVTEIKRMLTGLMGRLRNTKKLTADS